MSKYGLSFHGKPQGDTLANRSNTIAKANPLPPGEFLADCNLYKPLAQTPLPEYTLHTTFGK